MTYVCRYTPPEAEAVIRRMFTALEAGGWKVYQVYDGGCMERAGNVDEALEVIDSVEESYVFFRNGMRQHSVLLIPANEEDVIVDHTYSATGVDDFVEIMDSVTAEDES